MISLLLFVLIGKTAEPNVAVECFMTVHTVIIHVDTLRERNMKCKKCQRFWADGMLDHLKHTGEGCPICE